MTDPQVPKDRFELSIVAILISLDETGKSIFRVQSKNRIIASEQEYPRKSHIVDAAKNC